MRTSKNIYNYSSVEKYIQERLIPAGYEIVVIEGALVDNYICYAPDESYYNFIFLEKYINEWNSGIVYHKFLKIGRSEQEVINNLMAEKEEQEKEAEEFYRKKTA